MRTTRPAIVLVILAVMLGMSFALASTALAADGVRVVPAAEPSPYAGEFEPAISGAYIAYTCTNPLNSDDSVIRIKYLGDDSPPQTIGNRPAGYKDASPAILVQGDEITVVWTRMTLEPPWDSDLWIWKGTYGGAAAGFVPVDDVYPQALVTGPLDTTPVSTQAFAAIGLVPIAGEDHAVVAWEDTRDYAPWIPRIYYMDLTAETTWDPATAGTAADNTDIYARGQTQPAVGSSGIYWLDDRLSWWDSGDLKDTAVWRYDFGTFEAAAFFTDSNHTYDNGAYDGPKVTSNGAMWLREGPYGGPDVQMPFIKPSGGSGHTVGPIVQPLDPAAFTRAGASSTGLAIGGKHANSASSTDWDIFFYDTTAGVQVPVCDRSLTLPEAQAFKNNQMSPAIGNAFYAYRVAWVDQRDSAGEDTPDAKLYQAFVPTVGWSIRASAMLNLATLRVVATVKPDFSGEPVYLQRLTRTLSKGAVVYRPYRGYLAKAAMMAGPANSNSSVATLKWRPKVKGTYYLRVWFAGGAKYAADGATIATGNQTVVPHVANCSKVVKLTVK